MDFEKENKLRTSQLSFIGKVLSVFTHELNNHLAALKELAGLIEDILRTQKSLPRQELERCYKAIQSIESQIGKTSWISKHLCSFGLCMSKPSSNFDVNEIIEELLVLLNRAVLQKAISLKKDFHRNIPVVHSNPAGLQFLIFCLIEKGLKRLGKNGEIICKTSYSKGSVSVCIISRGDFINTDETETCTDEISLYLISQMEGNISRSAEDREVTITFPLSPRPSCNT